jgi:hypothetical protein
MRLMCVTVTGADNGTDPADLAKLSERYPFVEWGILLSHKAVDAGGIARFPGKPWLLNYATYRAHPMRTSGHLCGGWVRDLCLGGRVFRNEMYPLDLCFDRVQLNFHAYAHTFRPEGASALKDWQQHGPEEFIFQADGVNNAVALEAFRAGVKAVPLFDLSGGAGVLPPRWPKSTGGYVGYAGGLSPDNLEVELEKIAEAADGNQFWIDVETHVRSDNDQLFDLAKVERFLEIAAPHVEPVILA